MGKIYSNPFELLLNTIKYLSLLTASFIVLFPVYVVVMGAFKSSKELYDSPFGLPHSFLYLENFKLVFTKGDLLHAFFNTFIILAISLLGNIVLGTMSAYALGRFQFKLKSPIISAYLFAQIIPMVTTQVATYKIVTFFGLFNTIYAPIVLFLGGDVIQLIIYLQFIRNIPKDLDESAMMEGASLFRIYRTIIFPLLAPATATVTILKSVAIYNNFYIPFLYMPSQNLSVVSTSIFKFVGPYAASWQYIFADILVVFVPAVVIFLFFQKYIFSGVTSGAVK